MGIKKSRLETEEQFRARKDELIKMCKDSLLSQWSEELQSEFEDKVLKERYLKEGKRLWKEEWTQEKQDSFEREMSKEEIEIPPLDAAYRRGYHHGLTCGIMVKPEHMNFIEAEVHNWRRNPKAQYEDCPGRHYLIGIHQLHKEKTA